ncbi:hypothetical protein CHH55_21415 [Niallia circulans]|uniref:hypothetical protein n=1 Tax=Niallia circulans TaxID=1397 RepID=UPI000BA7360B|nr:hypothetical protein [Niallia circulans]PAD23432.1 hypothetical protein CHH62_22745 [Niallia circulans]PAD85772.1 hypothetical protein CHH55_21415 [Niallia circulans]
MDFFIDPNRRKIHEFLQSSCLPSTKSSTVEREKGLDEIIAVSKKMILPNKERYRNIDGELLNKSLFAFIHLYSDRLSTSGH